MPPKLETCKTAALLTAKHLEEGEIQALGGGIQAPRRC